jgi:hypothetical protein
MTILQKNRLLKSLIGAAAIMMVTSSAWADWNITKSEQDVFGNVNVTATSYGDNRNIIRFECGSSSKPFMAFLILSEKIDDEVASKFIHRNQQGQISTSSATLQNWNDDYIAVKVVDSSMLKGVADHMVTASQGIAIGIEITPSGFRVSDTFSSRGSTNAGKTVLQHCIKSVTNNSTGSNSETTNAIEPNPKPRLQIADPGTLVALGTAATPIEKRQHVAKQIMHHSDPIRVDVDGGKMRIVYGFDPTWISSLESANDRRRESIGIISVLCHKTDLPKITDGSLDVQIVIVDKQQKERTIFGVDYCIRDMEWVGNTGYVKPIKW